jgi:hypothetical protein
VKRVDNRELRLALRNGTALILKLVEISSFCVAVDGTIKIAITFARFSKLLEMQRGWTDLGRVNF